jgi:hypothetical protein
MPQTNPGSLSAQEYLDIMTYVLQANDFPAGPEELRTASPGMKTILNKGN